MIPLMHRCSLLSSTIVQDKEKFMVAHRATLQDRIGSAERGVEQGLIQPKAAQLAIKGTSEMWQ